MARGILTLTSRGTGSLAEAAKWVVVPALAIYPGSSNIGSLKMGASALDAAQTAPILSEATDSQKRLAASNKSVSKAIAKIAKKFNFDPKTGCKQVSLWCGSSSVVPRSIPIDDLGGLNVMLTEADKDSRLIIKHVRRAFGPLADNVVFDLTKSHIHMLYVEKHVQPLVIHVVETDDPNADSKIDEALKTAEMIWMQVMAANRRSALYEMYNVPPEQSRPVNLLPAFEKVHAWMMQVANNAAALSARNYLSAEAACWLHDVDSRVITRWCEAFFEKHPGILLRFEKSKGQVIIPDVTKRIYWDKNAGPLDDFIMHIKAKLRSTFGSNPKGAPTFEAPLQIQDCDPLDFETFQSKLGDRRLKVKMCADVPVIPGEKWIKIVRNMVDSATNRVLSSTLVFPAREFTAAFNLALSNQDFRTFPGCFSVWEREKAPQEKK